MATKSKLEYIWLDGFEPTQSMRSKTMVETDFSGNLEDCKMWSFDGSSTLQAEGGSSDCLLKPVAIYPDPDRLNGYLVMCEVYNADGAPHDTNGRATIDEDRERRLEQRRVQRPIFPLVSHVMQPDRVSSTALSALRMHSGGRSSRHI